MTAEQLRQWRARLGLTQADAAGVLETALSAYRNWEQGRRAPPTCLRLLCELVERLLKAPLA